MSRAVLIIALTRVLQRQPTPEEYESCRAALLERCPSGRVYIPAEPKQTNLFDDVVMWRNNGWSIRKIARRLGVSKSHVHNVLSTIPVVQLDTDPPNV
jgi:AraC-like DNA-binding protein